MQSLLNLRRQMLRVRCSARYQKLREQKNRVRELLHRAFASMPKIAALDTNLLQSANSPSLNRSKAEYQTAYPGVNVAGRTARHPPMVPRQPNPPKDNTRRPPIPELMAIQSPELRAKGREATTDGRRTPGRNQRRGSG